MGNPTVTPLSETRHAGGFIVYDPSDGALTTEQVTLKSGAGILTAGTVLAKILSGTSASAAKAGGNTGNGTCVLDATTPIQPRAKLGVYTLRCIAAAANGGTFRLEDPDGRVLGDFVMAAGSVTVSEQIKAVITDGATDFVVGDGFDITISALTPKFVAFDPTATDGSQLACAVLYSERKDASSADKKAAAVTRGPVKVNANELVWGANVTTTAQKTKALADLNDLGIRSI